ncbi:hypothetical protein J7L67_01545 [bacterium]|nr:hypothetical protein [bacterium]
MKRNIFCGLLLLSFFMINSISLPELCADDTLDGTWILTVKVVKGPAKGFEQEHMINITQDLATGRIDGKTFDDSKKQVGRVSGLVRQNRIEMTFSYLKDVYRSSLSLSYDGRFIGGIFRRVDGNEGVIYALKEKSKDSKE